MRQLIYCEWSLYSGHSLKIVLEVAKFTFIEIIFQYPRESAINPHISVCKPPLEENMVCGPINFFKNVYIGAQVQQACGPCKAGLVCKQVGYVGYFAFRSKLFNGCISHFEVARESGRRKMLNCAVRLFWGMLYLELSSLDHQRGKTVRRINHDPLRNWCQSVWGIQQYSDLSNGRFYPPFEPLEPGWQTGFTNWAIRF